MSCPAGIGVFGSTARHEHATSRRKHRDRYEAGEPGVGELGGSVPTSVNLWRSYSELRERCPFLTKEQVSPEQIMISTKERKIDR